MRTLPLFFEFSGFRAVHACWNETDIQQLKALTRHGVMSEDQLIKPRDPRRSSRPELGQLLHMHARDG